MFVFPSGHRVALPRPPVRRHARQRRGSARPQNGRMAQDHGMARRRVLSLLALQTATRHDTSSINVQAKFLRYYSHVIRIKRAAVPMYKVYQYNVQVAFIQSVIDPIFLRTATSDSK